MILAILVIFVLLAFYSMVYINSRTLSNILGIVFFLGVAGSIFAIVQNDHNHYGMKTVTETKTINLESAAPQKGMNMLLFQPVGSKGKENVYIYKTNEDQKKPKHTKADSNVSNKVVTDGSVKLVQTSKVRVYKSDFMKLMFGIADNDRQLVSRKNTFHVDDTWLVLSTEQAKMLQKKMSDKAFQAQMQEEGKVFVGQAVYAAANQNVQMNNEQQQQVIKKATAQFQAMKIKELLKNMK